MAYIKKHGNSWQAQVSWYDTDNTRKYKTKNIKQKVALPQKCKLKSGPMNLKLEKIRIKSRIMTLFF
nr:hypothetical protein [Lactobacillus sp. B4007]